MVLMQRLEARLSAVAERVVQCRRRTALAVTWGGLALVAWLTAWLWPQTGGLTANVATALALGAGLAIFIITRRTAPTTLDTARALEALYPELNARLITAIDQTPDVSTGRLSLLQKHLLQEALGHAEYQPWRALVPTWKLLVPGAASLLSLVMLGGVVKFAWSAPQRRLAARATGGVDARGNSVEPVIGVKVEPGDVELERGSSLLVLARFPEPLPSRVTLHVIEADGQQSSIPCEKSLDDPVFGARLPSVATDLSYLIAFDRRETKAFRVTVFDLPALVRSDLFVQSPEYTGETEKLIENAFEASIVEGASVEVRCRVNKPLASAKLVDRDGASYPMQPAAKDPTLWTTTLAPLKSQRYKLELADDRDRQNRDPEEFRLHVLPNKPPQFKLAFPGKDVRVSPLEELTVEGSVVDEFGVDEAGVVLQVAGREPQVIPLTKRVQGNAPFNVQHTQPFEDLNVQPDDLVSFYLYAVDRDKHGDPRRVTSDLFFAEVRPFEETFRQQDQPAGQAGGRQAGGKAGQQGNKIENVIQQQKQIVTATWNIQRAERKEWTAQTDEQVGTVAESQHLTRSQFFEQANQLPAAAQRLATSALERMETAERELRTAVENDAAESLATALAAEQAAYQALLRLRAKDHRVTQGQQAGGGEGGGGSASEQQLQNLELSDRKNRYEQRPSAGEQQTNAAEQRENLVVLDRLKELARRQNDLNDKLKELEAALRTAATREQQDEIQRQLKRLRDEQQQMLQDTDELRSKLAQSSRQERFAETREQLDKARERLLDATESLKEGQLSQALSSASRAERDLKQLQQDFRQQTSARFAEAMRDLREEAKQLVDREQKLAEKMEPQTDANQKTLRQNRDRQQLVDEFNEQRGAVGNVLKRARDLVQEAETAEPLLSQQLYDSLRKTRETKLEPALDAVPPLLQRGFVPEAQRAEAVARSGLEQLQEGFNKAAEAVLGDEVESLKRAKTELAELAQQLQRGFGNQGQPVKNKPGEKQPSENGAPGANGQSQDGQRQQPQSTPERGTGEGREPMPREGNQPAQNRDRGQGQQSVESPGQQPGDGQQPGQGQSPGQGQRQGEGQGQPPGPGNQPGQGQGQGQGQEDGQGQQPGDGNQPGGQQGGNGTGGGTQPNGQSSPRNNPRMRSAQARRPGSGTPNGGNNNPSGFGGGPGNGNEGPLTTAAYREWSDRLRDVETMVSDPALQAEVSKLRDQARSMRAEFKRHSQAPEWELVRTALYQPMVELQRKLAEEVARRESKDSLVPIDRDPVPTRYRDLVRSYYERLGRGGE